MCHTRNILLTINNYIKHQALFFKHSQNIRCKQSLLVFSYNQARKILLYLNATNLRTAFFVALQCTPLVIMDSEMKVVVTTFKVGGIARFSCSPTHFLDGNRTLKCLPHGEWSGIIPRCKSKLSNP